MAEKLDSSSLFGDNSHIDDFFNFKDFLKPTDVQKTSNISTKSSVPKVVKKSLTFKTGSKPPRYSTGTGYVKKFQVPIPANVLVHEFSGLNISGLSTGLSFGTSFDDSALFDTQSVVAPSVISEQYESQRKELSIFKHREEIISNVRNYPIVMISGPTGCGKSTQVPQYIFEDASNYSKHLNILISQPRKIAAITLAQRVAEERNENLGTLVGYQVGLDKCMNLTDEPTKMTFCTTGIILQKLLKQKSLARYSHIILDEVHERDLEIDFLIAIIRRLQSTSNGTKIILMSATLDVQKFQDYWKIRTNELENEFFYPPVIDLDQNTRRYEIVERYLDDIKKIEISPDIMDPRHPGISNEMYHFAIRLIILIFRAGLVQRPNILVFLPGLPEIERLQDEFRVDDNLSKLKSYNPEFHILHSSLSMDEQKRVFKTSAGSKIILATNIAESSITIPNVSYVIDFCLTKHLKNCKSSQMSTFVLDWASKNNCKQRAGRTGRVSKGTVFRLVYKSFYYRNLREHSIPEMQLAPLESIIVKIKDFNMGEPLEIFAGTLDPPEEQSIVNAVLCLKEHGGLLIYDKDDKFCYNDGEFTFLGEIMSAIPCDVRITKLIVLGYLFSVLDEAIVIAAGLNFKGIFINTLTNRMDDYICKVKWSKGTGSDCLATFNAYNHWYEYYRLNYFKTLDEQRDWCRKNGLDVKNLHEMRIWIDEVKKRLKYFKIENLPYSSQPLWTPREKILVLKIIMAGAFGNSNFFTTETQIEMERDAFQMFYNFDTFRTVYCRGMDRSIFGNVYKKQLKDILVEKGVCDENTRVNIDFDSGSERVNIMFEDSDDDQGFLSGQVAPEVYKSVKLRHLEGSLKLNVMTSQETMNFAAEHGYYDCQIIQPFIEHPEHWPYPTKSTLKMQGFVTHVIHCNKFFFCPLIGYNTQDLIPDTRYEKALKNIKTCLKTFEMVPLMNVEQKLIKSGQMVVYKNIEIQENERAEFIRFVDENDVEIRLMDRGMYIVTSIKYVFKVKNSKEAKKLRMYPSRVFECRLKEIQPSARTSHRNKWSASALNEFNGRVLNKKAFIDVYSIVSNVVAVELNTVNDQLTVNLNQKLLELGYAQECEESFTSKINHNGRVQNYKSLRDPVDPKDEFATVKDENFLKLNQFSTPDIKMCDRQIKLIGPYSPLETKLCAISAVTGYVRIDSTSINHVLINDEILSLHDKFYIAADVNVSAVNGNVKARETTEMPNIPGLSCLLAMIFSPTAQLRRDNDKTRYISLITGLGLDKSDEKPYFKERDTIQCIDFDLQENDIADINRLRFSMSLMLYRDPFHKLPDLTDRQREQTLKHIKELLLAIINKNREIRDIQMGKDHLMWNVDQDDVSSRTNRIGHGCIWNHIPIPPLDEMTADMKLNLIKHANFLENPGSLNYIRECKLCGKSINGQIELNVHLMSKLHLLRKGQLGIP